MIRPGPPRAARLTLLGLVAFGGGITFAAFPSVARAQDGEVTVTTAPVELGESTSITRATVSTSTTSAVEVKGEQVVVDRATDWWWWLLLLLLLPALGLLVGMARQRFQRRST